MKKKLKNKMIKKKLLEKYCQKKITPHKVLKRLKILNQ